MSENYEKSDGTPCTLEWLVRNEPEWAANRIRVGHQHLRERDEARAAVEWLKAELVYARSPEGRAPF